MELALGDQPKWFGTGWLVTMTVVWVIVALAAIVYQLAAHSAPNGLYSYDEHPMLYNVGTILVVYVVPLGIGWLAYAAGYSLSVCAWYLTPHVATPVLIGAFIIIERMTAT
jgi:heme/copper-type cytochrome/quinol oxidase subunit 2